MANRYLHSPVHFQELFDRLNEIPMSMIVYLFSKDFHYIPLIQTLVYRLLLFSMLNIQPIRTPQSSATSADPFPIFFRNLSHHRPVSSLIKPPTEAASPLSLEAPSVLVFSHPSGGFTQLIQQFNQLVPLYFRLTCISKTKFYFLTPSSQDWEKGVVQRGLFFHYLPISPFPQHPAAYTKYNRPWLSIHGSPSTVSSLLRLYKIHASQSMFMK